MALSYTVRYGASATVLSNIQSINFSTGRRWIADPYSAGTATIICRDIANWPATPPRIGNRIYFSNTASGVTVWGGRIRDVAIEYGIVPAEDEAIISVEGVLAQLARKQLNAEVFTQKRSGNYIADILTASGVTIGYYTAGSSFISAQTYTGSALDLVNEVTLTEVGRLAEVYDDVTNEPVLNVLARNDYEDEGYVLSDVSSDYASGGLPYREIEFKSAAESYYTQVTIQPSGLASQTETVGTAPYYGLTQESLDYTVTQADSHASYLVKQFASTVAYPTSISVSYEALTNNTQRAKFREMITNDATNATINSLISIKFRGTTYYAVVEGLRVSMTPSTTVATWQLSSKDQNSYLRWGTGNIFNRWDYNKWGF
jgi:hypothetical protein